jgi:type II secretory pathway component PulK
MALILLSVLLILAGGLSSNLIRAYSMRRKDHLQAKAFHIAEGGLHKALWELSSSSADYAGEKETSLGEGSFRIEVVALN